MKNLMVWVFCFLAMMLKANESIPKVSVLTCAPGKEIYSIYGHNAIRLQYKDGRDFIFNYGTFDFNTPNFTLKFIRGRLPYMLSVNYFPEFIEEYTYYRREVTEQTLDLDSIQTTELVGLLEENLKPENRAYKYDFFYDNCATRIFDIVEKATGGKIEWKEGVLSGETFRSRIKQYQQPFPWTDFGIDIIIGSKADQKLTVAQDMFLPDYVLFHFQGAKINKRNLVINDKRLLEFTEESGKGLFLLQPLFLFSLFLFFEIFLWFYNPETELVKKRTFLYDKIWFNIILFLAVFIFFMWFFTDHIPVKDNLNILWTLPAALFLHSKTRKNKVTVVVALSLLTISTLNAFGLSILPQYFHPAFGVICLIMILKWLRNVKRTV